MLKSIELKNAVGIKNGKLNKDYIKIDFNKLFPHGGLIALLGDNGYGKSTILECCHPFKKTVTGNKRFKELFINETGEKTVVYEFDKDEYTFTLKVNNGLVKGTVLKNGVPLGEEGRAKEYDYVVKKLFGNSKTFFKTNFKGGESSFISNLKKVDLKKHFIEVLGLEEYKEMNDKIISKHLKNVNKELEIIQTSINLLEKQLQDKSEIKVKTLLESKIDKQDILLKDIYKINYKITKIEKQHEKILNNKDKIQEIHKDITLISKNLINLNTELNELDSEINNIRSNSKKLEEDKILLNKDIKELEKTKKENEKLLNNKDEIEKEKTDKDILQIKINDLRTKMDSLNSLNFEKTIVEKEKNLILKDIEKIDNRLNNKPGNPFNVCNTCPLANEIETLQKEKALAEEKLPIWIEKLKNLENELGNYEETKKDLEESIKQLESFVHTDEKWKKIIKFKDELINTTWKLNKNKYNLQTLETTLQTNKELIDEKNKNVNSLNTAIFELQSKISEKETEIKSLKVDLDTTELDNLKKELKLLEMDSKNFNEAIIKLRIELEYIQKYLKEKEEFTKKLEDLLYEKEGWEIAAFTFNEKNGLPFIELKNACPIIEDMANKLLLTIWPEFKIKFKDSKLQKLKGKKTTEEVDYFDVIVERPGKIDTSISDLSKGEKVVVDSCLSLATVIFMKNKNSHQINTLFLDEIDGALSEFNSDLFFVLLDKAHKEANCKQTIFITHNVTNLPPISKLILDKNAPSGNGYKFE